MKEPERWIVSRAGREGQWIRAALSEEPPDAALGRVASRLSSAGVAVGALGATVAHATHAGASVYAGVTNGTLIGSIAGTASVNAPLLVGATLLKAVLVGVGIGGVALVGGHWAGALRSRAATERESTGHATSVIGANSPNGVVLAVPKTQSRMRKDVLEGHRPRNSRVSPPAHRGPGPVGAIEPTEVSQPTGATRPTEVTKSVGAIEPAEANDPAVSVELEPPVPSLDVKSDEGLTSFSGSTRGAGDTPAPALTGMNRIDKPDSRALADEVAALARTRQALKQGNATGALRELSALDALGGNLRLGQEAALLRVEALALSGQKESAARLANQLLTSGVAEAHRVRLEQLAQQQR